MDDAVQRTEVTSDIPQSPCHVVLLGNISLDQENLAALGLKGLQPADPLASRIVIAMLGNLHPMGVALAAFFFSIINVGAQTMSRMTDIPTYIVGVMEGTALIVMLIFLLLTEYRIKWTKR